MSTNITIERDFTTDQNPDLLMWLAEKGAVPDYVLDSDVCASEDFEKLACNAFADPQERLYPCNTKEACWLSAAHYVGRGGSNPTIIGNIAKMADWHGIKDDVDNVWKVLSEAADEPVEKSASAEHETRHALELEYDDGSVHSFYPIDNGLDIITSSETAASDFRSRALPLPSFHKVAMTICDAADENGVNKADLASEVVRYGERRLPDPYTGQVLVSMRKSAGIDPQPYNMLIDALREGLAKAASVEMSAAIAADVAERMYAIDSAYGLNYGPRMVDPFTAIFSGPLESDLTKFASTTIQVDDINVPSVELLNLSDKKIDLTFSQASADVIKEAKAIIREGESVEACDAATEKVASLSPEARKVLLATLAGVAW